MDFYIQLMLDFQGIRDVFRVRSLSRLDNAHLCDELRKNLDAILKKFERNDYNKNMLAIKLTE